MNENSAITPPKTWVPEVSISLSGFQVARREFFALTYNPALFLAREMIKFNGPCLKSMPDVSYVQILINPDEKLIAVRPGKPDDKDVLRWCSSQNRSPRTISCPMFYFKVLSLMNWNPAFRYKLLGKLVSTKGERLMLFDLTHPVAQKLNDPPFRPVAGEKNPTANRPQDYYPREWLNSFGTLESDHQTAMTVATFNGHTIFGVPSEYIATNGDLSKETEETST
ncbi:MAG: integrase [Lachnospiraceae bacterium]|nr:integrase [Lachnospiraceae bacterium]